MSEIKPKIEFLNGVEEQLSNVKLRQGKESGLRNIVLVFDHLNAINLMNSFTKGTKGTLQLTDSEGKIAVTPSSIKVRFGGDDGDDLEGVTCQIDIDQEEQWERMMRFLHRYADANGMAYQEK
ncbi:MAG: photosystem II reaction center protein Psb28 [Kamptonema sp. SIO4C4]|nr:photosystem II reaction center protein Psb28 [Kamptonema sp. SIO4C4]